MCLFEDCEEALVAWMTVIEAGRKGCYSEEQREWLRCNTPLAIFDDDNEAVILAEMFAEMIDDTRRFSASLNSAKVILTGTHDVQKASEELKKLIKDEDEIGGVREGLHNVSGDDEYPEYAWYDSEYGWQ